jgi:hypothetical protein
MKAKPIPLKTWEVQAILDSRKTQTRRVVKPQPQTLFMYMSDVNNLYACFENSQAIPCPYGQPGDVLWVRETWGQGVSGKYYYKADKGIVDQVVLSWKPSIHMPREAARLFLRIKSVRVERLQEIKPEDAIREGYPIDRELAESRNVYIEWFKSLWQSINGPESWAANPFVWVVEFERITREEAGL